MNGNLPRPSTIEVDHLGVSVRDLGRSLDFYCRILGAVLVMPPRPVDDFNFRRAVVTFDGSMVIDLNEHVTNSGEAFDPTRTGLDHLAFQIPSYDALEAWVAYLEAHGMEHSPIRTIEGVGEAVDFRDPDGIQIELWHMDRNGQWAHYVQKKLAAALADPQGSVP
ncbi:MAG TPA: VOC family protein [Acidimicrobiales bacterium]|nr:VOC family protein [Acidimicrobiales bacterium]